MTSKKLVHPKTGKALTDEDRRNNVQGVAYQTWCRRRLVHPKTGKALTDEDRRNDVQGVAYQTWHKRRLVHPKTGKALTDEDRQKRVQSVAYNTWYKQRSVHLETGKALTNEDLQKRVQSVAYNTWYKQRLVHPETGKALTNEDRQKRVQGITYNTRQMRKLVHPETGKALTDEDHRKRVQGVAYQTWYKRRLVHPETGKALTDEDRQKRVQGVKYNTWYRQRLVHPETGKVLTDEDRQKRVQGVAYQTQQMRRSRKRKTARPVGITTLHLTPCDSTEMQGVPNNENVVTNSGLLEKNQQVYFSKKLRRVVRYSTSSLPSATPSPQNVHSSVQGAGNTTGISHQSSQSFADSAVTLSPFTSTDGTVPIKQEPSLLGVEEPECQILKTGVDLHRTDNSLPILQDPHDLHHSLLLTAEKPIDSLRVSGWGLIGEALDQLPLPQSQVIKRKMVQKMKTWLNDNEFDRPNYQKKLDDLFYSSIPLDSESGRGLSTYAKRPIARFEVVGPYAGALHGNESSLRASFRQHGMLRVNSYAFFTYSKERTVDAYQRGNSLSLINTGQLIDYPAIGENNLAVVRLGKNLNFYVALRDIAKDEELLVDYGPTYGDDWRELKTEPVGSNEERQVVQSAQIDSTTTEPDSELSVSALRSQSFVRGRFAAIQGLPSNNIALLGSSGASPSLIPMPGEQNNCLLYSTLYAMRLYLSDVILQRNITQLIENPTQGDSSSLTALFQAFRRAAGVNSQVFLGADHGKQFINWLKARGMLNLHYQYNLIEFHSRTDASGHERLIRDGEFNQSAGVINLVLWNSGNHYSVINITPNNLATLCDNATPFSDLPALNQAILESLDETEERTRSQEAPLVRQSQTSKRKKRAYTMCKESGMIGRQSDKPDSDEEGPAAKQSRSYPP